MNGFSVGFRCPVGFKNYPPYLSGSTEILTPTATRLGSEGGRKPALGAANPDSMTDSETQCQECNESIDFEEFDFSGLGRELLQARLERDAMDLCTRLRGLAQTAKDDEFGEVELAELRRLHSQLTETVHLVESHAVFDGNLMTEASEGDATDK